MDKTSSTLRMCRMRCISVTSPTSRATSPTSSGSTTGTMSCFTNKKILQFEFADVRMKRFDAFKKFKS